MLESKTEWQSRVRLENQWEIEDLDVLEECDSVYGEATVTFWLNIIDQVDPGLGQHSWRVTRLVTRLGKQLRLGQADQVNLRWGALLHDIGKLRIEKDLLGKPGKLSSWEKQRVQQQLCLGWNC